MKYKKNYIENFIFRIDIKKNKQETIEKMLEQLKIDFKETLNNLKSRDVITKNFEINDQEGSLKIADTEKITEYRLANRNDTEFITIANEYICYENTSYNCFEQVQMMINQLIDSISKASNIELCSRLGMRFINDILLPSETKEQILDWNGYIKGPLLASIDFFKEDHGERILQAMNVIDIESKKDSNLYYTLQFGLYNSKTPGQMLDKQYIIDIDGRTKTVEDLEMVKDKIDIMHYEIEEIFEKMIDEKMRQNMGVI